MASALDILAPYIPTAEEITYNPTLHGPDGLTATVLHGIGVMRYLSHLTGAEEQAEVLAVTCYGWSLGLARPALLPGWGQQDEMGEDIPLPFEAARLYLLDALERPLYEAPEDLGTLWGNSDIATYRGVGRAAIANADRDGHMRVAPLYQLPGGAKLYSPGRARQWSDSVPRRARG